MNLKNKKTGETGYYLHTHRDYKYGHIKVAVLKDGVPFSEFKPYEPIYDYDSLAELEREWEDYEEPKKYWFIDAFGNIVQNKITKHSGDAYTDMSSDYESQKRIGNYFETEEEAEKAVGKLKAWKRLKEAGFEFKKWKHKPLFSYHYGTVKQNDGYKIYIEAGSNKLADYMQDLDLLFNSEGGE